MKKSNEQPSPEAADNLRDQQQTWHLELPDAPDFISRRSLLPLDRALEFVEEMRRMFPLTERQRALREEMRCTEEFIL
jgi:hypothetical protein